MDLEIERLEPAWIKKALLRSIHEQEKLRSQYLVDKFRSNQTDHVPNVELPSVPVHTTNRHDQGLKHFDETSHHRNYAAVRCVVAKPGQRPDVVKEAERATARMNQYHKQKMERREMLDIAARGRYQDAINGVAMDQKKEKMLQHLSSLDIEDRQRKQINATFHANTFRPHFVYMGEEKMASRFTSHFQIEYAGSKGGIDVDRTPTITKQRRQPLDTMSVGSFEFNTEGPQVVLLNKRH
ncbi:hypothetical protein HDU91_004724 [Kappamyces sp. JEL0680]|nr:hypothetical protein HDU91_004724 [Kappamyces sp. JEL0680]